MLFNSRLRKSRSMIFSLYSLSIFGLVLGLVFLITMMTHLVSHFQGSFLWSQRALALHSVFDVLVAVLCAAPLAFAFTYLSVIWEPTRFNHLFTHIFDSMRETPVLLLGVVFFYFFRDVHFVVVCSLFVVAVSQLAQRWIHLSSRVNQKQIDCLLSLGYNLVGVTRTLYLRQFWPMYLLHMIAVCCNLFVMVAPLLFLQIMESSGHSLSLDFYVQLGEQTSLVAGLAFLLLVVHTLRVIMDFRTSFMELEIG